MGRRLLLYLFNLYFYTLFLACVIVLIPLFTVCVAVSRTYSTHRQTMKRFRRAMVWWGRVVAALPYPVIKIRYELSGVNDISKPYIFVCNHRSAVDAFLMKVLPHEFVEIVNDWPFKIPVLGYYARFAAFLNIRNMTPECFRTKATQLLDEGVSIIFFPEGTRTTGRQMGSFHSAAFRLALESGAAIIPVCMTGNEIVMPKGATLLRPGTITIRQLPPLDGLDFAGLSSFSLKQKVWKLMDRELSLMEKTA